MAENEKLPVLDDVGGQGFKRYNGVVAEEFHANLRGKLGMRVYREMLDNDPLLGGAFRGMGLLIRQADWPVKCADVKKAVDAGHGDEKTLEAEANRWKDRLEECMYDMDVPWRQVIGEMLTAFPYGFCLMWIKYKLRRGDNESKLLNSQYDDGLWGWRSIEIRKQDTIEQWVYADDDETLIGAEQVAPPRYKRVTLPMERMVHVRFDTASGSPEKSGFRNSYRSYYFGNRKEEVEGTGTERDLSGYPVAFVPKEMLSAGADASQRAQVTMFRDMVRKVKRDELEGMVYPHPKNHDGSESCYDFKLLSSGGSRAINLNESIVRDRVAKLIPLMWEFAMLGSMPNGSKALSSDKTDLVSVALGGMMDIMAETLNLSLVRKWCRLNSVPRWLWPEITHGDIEKENVLEWVQSLAAAASSSLFVPTDNDEKKVREKLGLDQRAPDDTILQTTEDDVLGMGLPDTAPVPAATDTEVEPTEVEDSTGPGEMMTLEEAQEWLNVPRSSIMRAIRNGKLPGGKVGASYRIPRAYLEDHFKPSGPASPPAA